MFDGYWKSMWKHQAIGSYNAEWHITIISTFSGHLQVNSRSAVVSCAIFDLLNDCQMIIAIIN